MIELTDLTKKYADKTAVNRLSFQIHPGKVTGFLGPNGAGKSTTIRMILHLTLPTSGSVTVDGQEFRKQRTPLKKIGAMVDAAAIDPRLTPKQYLEILATGSGIAAARAEELLCLVGLKEVCGKKIAEFSFGMRQRVGLAAALLGDPETLILDEPFNGLDVKGIHWLRSLLRRLAAQGKAVFVSSHLLSEIQEIAERIIILEKGRRIADMSMAQLQEKSFLSYVQVRTDDPLKLHESLKAEGAQVERKEDQSLQVRTLSPKQIGDIAFEKSLRIYELSSHRPSLEQLFAELTEGKDEYGGTELCGSGKERTA